jgi:hypothetical protein
MDESLATLLFALECFPSMVICRSNKTSIVWPSSRIEHPSVAAAIDFAWRSRGCQIHTLTTRVSWTAYSDTRAGSDGKPDVLSSGVSPIRVHSSIILSIPKSNATSWFLPKLRRCRIQILSRLISFSSIWRPSYSRHGVHLFQKNTVIQQVSKIFSRSRDLRLRISAVVRDKHATLPCFDEHLIQKLVNETTDFRWKPVSWPFTAMLHCHIIFHYGRPGCFVRLRGELAWWTLVASSVIISLTFRKHCSPTLWDSGMCSSSVTRLSTACFVNGSRAMVHDLILRESATKANDTEMSPIMSVPASEDRSHERTYDSARHSFERTWTHCHKSCECYNDCAGGNFGACLGDHGGCYIAYLKLSFKRPFIGTIYTRYERSGPFVCWSHL